MGKKRVSYFYHPDCVSHHYWIIGPSSVVCVLECCLSHIHFPLSLLAATILLWTWSSDETISAETDPSLGAELRPIQGDELLPTASCATRGNDKHVSLGGLYQLFEKD